MSDTSSWLLRLLSLLQMPRMWPENELAARLRVSRLPSRLRHPVGAVNSATVPLPTADAPSVDIDRITEPVPTGQRFTARLPAGVDRAEFAMNKLYSTAPVFRAVVTVRRPDARARELLGGWVLDEKDGRLASPPDTVEWLIDHLAELAARVTRAIR